MAKNALYEVAELSSNEKVGIVTDSLLSLHNRGACEDDAEVQRRVDDYFTLCRNGQIRPGIESLACALCVSRITIWNWAQGYGCSKERQTIIQNARQMIHAVLEEMAISGLLNPATGIFLMKNWMGYRDAVEVETTPQSAVERTSEQIMANYNQNFLEEGSNEDFEKSYN